MATIVFAAAGAALGAGMGGTVLGLSGAVIGRAVGATIGRAVDQRIMGLGSDAVEVGKLDRFHIMGASEGAPIAKCWGRMRLAGQVIWASPFRETSRKTGGKGMPSPRTVQYSYTVSLAIALCEGEILGIGRIWADGDEISPATLNLRAYNGTEDQLPDPLIEARMGSLHAPAYRGIAYVVIEELDLSAYGNRVPQFSFEVMRRAQGAEAEQVSDLQDAIRAVALIPGTGEYALGTKKVRVESGFGVSRTLNANTPSGETDLVTSLTQLQQELPNCKAVALVVSWFGNDLRCASCEVQPKVEQKDIEAAQNLWRSGGVGRNEAAEVPRLEGRSIYGGTPADSTVIEAIVALRESGQSVMFYPFILMDQMTGNTLDDPYSENGFQPALPWRGRVTVSVAPGRDGSPDESAAAEAEVAAFFGAARVEDFSITGSQVFYHGEPKWGYRRFILHYAHLCKLAGGVESFCIGSEMRGLTQIRGLGQSFPAVQALIQLAADVRSIVGPDVKLSYAADWSEYFGYHVNGNVYFHLDPLWSSSHIDFIGIDNYMPISDWRDTKVHADSDWLSIYNLDYLQSNIMGGEGFDWYYSGQEGFDAQNRIEIRDTHYGEDWIFRYKDLKSWWSNPHHNRIDGIRQGMPTDWIPGAKPFRFTEYGCAAIDKGTNEPNKFLDSKSSESAIPRASTGARDDFIQMQYFRAQHAFWSDPAHNPTSELFAGSMVDRDHSYAWAWDARPYPAFPRATDLWSDGDNYFRGHWLNGRATSVPLDRAVREVCENSGVQDIDTQYLFGLVYGYGVSENQSGRSRLQPLSVTYGFDCTDKNGILSFQTRGLSSGLTLDKDQITVARDNSSSLQLTRLSDSDAVGRVRFAYISADGGFKASVAEVALSDVSSPAVVETEYQLVLPADTAKATARKWLIESLASRDRITLDLPPSMTDLRNGETLSLDGLIYRIDSTEFDQKLSIVASCIEPSIYPVQEQETDPQRWFAYRDVGPIARVWLDLPLITGSQSPYAPFLAVTADPWTGPAVLWSASEDSDYSVNKIFYSTSHIGKTLSDLDACRSGIVDRGRQLIVEIQSGVLESTSATGLLSGKNLVAIGGDDPEQWEVFQFMTAELLSPGVFALSMRLRGLAGTDAFMPMSWPAGSRIVLIDDSLSQISLADDHLNIELHYRLGFSSEGIGSDVVKYDILTFRGAGLRPLSVSHLRYSVDEHGNHIFNWMRRTRTGGDSWEGYDVPLGEERELYSFVVKSNEGAVLFRQVLSEPSFLLSLSQRELICATGAYSVEVSQVSSAFGTGAVARLALHPEN
ncbi:MAG: glycoside hydrolase/phage tail family protein [Pseudotabrizicola sp.]|uniref:baseplate multidomain protein megatron n=1 Tax=Pseudotabrizicola sp. TaxID=2939647 RepID=UPI0027290895|nr:glycoside hydrolase/phage tail family protein [Pseudotabrizicola sp.]MDO9638797.1 glycoside hydrolase/phage tail family protein [Pseudotabrizicola sp.]